MSTKLVITKDSHTARLPVAFPAGLAGKASCHDYEHNEDCIVKQDLPWFRTADDPDTVSRKGPENGAFIINIKNYTRYITACPTHNLKKQAGGHPEKNSHTRQSRSGHQHDCHQRYHQKIQENSAQGNLAKMPCHYGQRAKLDGNAKEQRLQDLAFSISAAYPRKRRLYDPNRQDCRKRQLKPCIIQVQWGNACSDDRRKGGC